MRPAQCPFCQRANPLDSKFCNACGAPLHLAPCPRCGAVNDAAATVCHQCEAELPESSTDEFPPSLSTIDGADAAGSGAHTTGLRPDPLPKDSLTADGLDSDARAVAALEELRQLLARSDAGLAVGSPDRDSPGPRGGAVVVPGSDALRPHHLRLASRNAGRRRSTIIVGIAVLAALAASVYDVYRQLSVGDFPEDPMATGEAGDRDGPANADTAVDPRKGATGVAAAGSMSAAAATPAATADTKPIAAAAESSVPAVRPGTVVRDDARLPAGAPVARAITPAVPADSKPMAAAPESSVPAVRPGTVIPGDTRPPVTTPVARSSGATMEQRRGDTDARGSSATAAPAVPAAVPRPRAPEAGLGFDLQQPRLGPCTEVVASLGLCTPEPTQRRE